MGSHSHWINWINWINWKPCHFGAIFAHAYSGKTSPLNGIYLHPTIKADLYGMVT
jgi:hypothetical protein